MRRRTIASLAVALALSVFLGSVRGERPIYDPGSDPGVGMNLVSWWNFGTEGSEIWQDAVQDLYDHGFRHVSFVPTRFVDKSTGHLEPEPYDKAPNVAHVAAGVARANSLGMTVTINPFVQPKDWSWRGFMNFSGANKNNFFADYTDYLREVAQVAQNNGAARMTIGSELRAMTQDASHNDEWGRVIDAVDAAYDGQLGYAANWDAYRGGNLTSTIWENSKIDFLGVDAYFPLATNSQADASGPHPDENFIGLIEDKWTKILNSDDGLGGSVGMLEFAEARKGGDGMPVVFTEHGLTPFNRTTVLPYSEDPGFNEPDDPDEQVNGYEALFRATDGMAADGQLLEIDLWHWGMPGAEDSFWYTHPEATDVGGDKFQESLSQAAGQFVSAYAIPEPSSFAIAASMLPVLGIGAGLWSRRRGCS